MQNEETLFDEHTITTQHVESLWRRHGCFASDTGKAIREATRLANTDPRKAAEYLADNDPRVMTHGNLPQLRGTSGSRSREDTVALFEEALADPDSIPKLYPEPSLTDCVRIAKNLDSEAGRCLAWLLNQWPSQRTVPQPPALGDRDFDNDGSTALHIGTSGADLVRTISVHPWAEKESVKVSGVTDEQMVATGRWFLGQAREQLDAVDD